MIFQNKAGRKVNVFWVAYDGGLKLYGELKPGVTELVIHCGYDNQELQAITHTSSELAPH